MTTIESIVSTISDNKILINEGETGAGVVTLGTTAGLVIDRGTLVNYSICFDEVRDCAIVGELGDEQCVATREDAPIANALPFWNDVEKRFDTDVELTYDPTTNTLIAEEVCVNGNVQTDYIIPKLGSQVCVDELKSVNATIENITANVVTANVVTVVELLTAEEVCVNGNVQTDYIIPKNGDNVNITGNVVVDPLYSVCANIKTSLIAEKEVGSGVVVDGVTIKNGAVETNIESVSVKANVAAMQSINSGLMLSDGTPVEWEFVEYDNNMLFDQSANTKITVMRDGAYLFNTTVTFDSDATGDRRVALQANVAGDSVIFASSCIPAASSKTILNVTGTVKLNENDFVQVLAFQNSGSSLEIHNATLFDTDYFNGHFLHAC